MAPRVARKDRSGAASRADAPADAPQPVALVSPEEAALRAKLKELRAELTKNSDYVGPRFAEEARKIHYRRDRSSLDPWRGDARGCHAPCYEEGIEFHLCPACRRSGTSQGRARRTSSGAERDHVVDGDVARQAPFIGERVVDDAGEVDHREAGRARPPPRSPRA